MITFAGLFIQRAGVNIQEASVYSLPGVPL